MRKTWLIVILLFAVVCCAQQQTATKTFTIQIDHWVFLNWTASTSSPILGYNIYRGTTAGGPYTKIGTTVKVNFQDTSVISGVIYYYAISAYDQYGESCANYDAVNKVCLKIAYSNEAKTTIPSP